MQLNHFNIDDDKAMQEQLKISFGGYSDSGSQSQNQDAYAAYCPEDEQIFSKGAIAAIADGVSDSSQAHTAAITCVNMFIQDYLATPPSWTPQHAAGRVIKSLNLWCHGQSVTSQNKNSDLLTTLTSVIFHASKAHIFHVGDSRVYRYSHGVLHKLTRDHHRSQSGTTYLSRAVGIDPYLDVDYIHSDILEDDVFILTTDGLHDHLSDKKMDDLLEKMTGTAEDIAQALGDAAAENGSTDNHSCLVCKIDTLSKSQPHSEQRYEIAPKLDAGMKLHHFRVVEVNYHSSHSSLYQVLDEKSGNSYSLKCATIRTQPENFLRERWISEQLQPSNQIVWRAVSNDFPYLCHIGEPMHAQSVRQWIIDHPKPSLQTIRRIARQLVQVLRKMQRLDIVCRNLHPEHLLVTEEGMIKLTDFSLAHSAVLAASLDQNFIFPSDRKHRYLAPEIRTGMQADFRADMYTAAAIFVEMLTGRSDIALDKPQELTQLFKTQRPDLPSWVIKNIQPALATSAEKRYQALSELEIALDGKREQSPPSMRVGWYVGFWPTTCGLLLLLNLIQWLSR